MRLPVKITVLAAHVEGSLYLQDEGLTHWIRKKNAVALAGITKIHDVSFSGNKPSLFHRSCQQWFTCLLPPWSRWAETLLLPLLSGQSSHASMGRDIAGMGGPTEITASSEQVGSGGRDCDSIVSLSHTASWSYCLGACSLGTSLCAGLFLKSDCSPWRGAGLENTSTEADRYGTKKLE